MDEKLLADMVAKEQIRELAMLYSRGVDRKDIDLLRTLYAEGSYDNHGSHFSGSAEDYLAFLEKSFPALHISAHCICNHLVSVDGDQGEGEVYAIAYHVFPDRKGGWIEDVMVVRYVDRYVRQNGRWMFASRDVMFDHRSNKPIEAPTSPFPSWSDDASFNVLKSRLFARGGRE